MSKEKLTKLSLSLLPVEDLQELLRVQYDFITADDEATDTKNVAGENAKRTALAVEESDRETVLNSLRLGGKPANEYLTIEDGGQISTNYSRIREAYSHEIRSLRDELYQLRGELVKSGTVTNYNLYSGFQDAFRNADILYRNKPITSVMEDSLVQDEAKIGGYAFSDLDVGDYIVFHFKYLRRYHVARIEEKRADGETIKFSPSTIHPLRTGMVDVYKSLGRYDNGTFSFSESANDIPAAQEKYSTLNDDTFRHRKNITAPNTGFGYCFRIPDSMQGFLVRANIKLTTYGTPGALMAYIINEKDIAKFKNPKQAEEDGILVAKSSPLTHPASHGERVVAFEFYDGTEYPKLVNDDTVDKKTRFCFIIEALDADSNNYYRVMFLQNKSDSGELGDLQLNNIVYEYTRKSDASSEESLFTNSAINNSDLYYGIVTRGIINNGVRPHREGVYTAKIEMPFPLKSSRARLSLRVNREGYFSTNNAGEISYQDGNNVPVKKEQLGNHYDMMELGGFGVRIGEDNVAIGTNIRKALAQSQDSIQIQKGAYLDGPNLPVYRIGYKVYLKASRKEYDPITNKFIVVDKEKIELPLKAIMPDRIKKSSKISDRLIFENEFVTSDDERLAKYFNDYELQIYWRTGHGPAFDNERYREDLVGKIHDLTLSFDKSI